MTRLTRAGLVFLAVNFVAICGAVSFCRAGSPPEKPRLIVLFVVDQLRADYLFRWKPHFCRGGFRLFMEEGASFESAYLSYGSTATGPGHATIATGRTPRLHGIVGNKWYLEPGVTTPEAAVADLEAEALTTTPLDGATGKSPRSLIGNTLGDQMRLSDRRSRVFTIALKDRAAIFMGGKRANFAFWYETAVGEFASSTYYGEALPDYMQELNRERLAEKYAGKSWERLLPEEIYAGAQPLKEEWHERLRDYGVSFPHTLPGTDARNFYTMLFSTPFGNEIVLEGAKRILLNENLGQGSSPDMLCIGLSANDYVGHAFGPDSAEVMDMTLQTDRQLASFLELLDASVGLDKCLLALTGDHGVSSAPAVSQSLGFESGLLDTRDLAKKLNEMLERKFEPNENCRPVVLGVNLPFIYCDPRFDELDDRTSGDMTREIMRFLRKYDGIEAVYSKRELTGEAPSSEDQGRFEAWQCCHPDRSGHFYIQLSSFWYQRGGNFAGHTAGFRSDRHVPVLFHGPGVRRSRNFVEAHSSDIAPTLAALLGIEPPAGASGKVLNEAMERAPY